MRSPIPYYGGKTKLAHRIVAMMPAHETYIEPFFGSGAVFFAKAPARHEIINDLDGAVVNFFAVLRDNIDELERRCALTPHARDEWEAASEPTTDPVEQARRFWCRVNQSFNKINGPNTGWSVTTSRTQAIPGSIATRLGRFRAAAERLMTVTIENRDAVDIIEALAKEDAVVYVDPPYLGITRRQGRGTRPSDYNLDMPAEADHRRLAAALHETPASVILSGYHSPLYDELYGDWPHYDHQTTASSGSARQKSRTPRTETLWMNRPPRQLTLETT
jgi:DNA adenine methylase